MLTTARLHLRPPIEADETAISVIAGDWEVARRLSRVPHPYEREHFRFFMDSVVPNEATWAIVLKESTELVGVMSLVPHPQTRSAELGYYVGRPYWGQGLATEAGRAVVQTAFHAEVYAKLTSGYHADNPASGRVLEKLGFRPVGLASRFCLAEGKDKPSIEVALLPMVPTAT